MTFHGAHTRIHVSGSRPDIAVPQTRVQLTNGEAFDRYATEGPGATPEVGLPRLRADWVEERGDTVSYTGREVPLLDNGRSALRRGAAAEEWQGENAQPRKAISGRNVTQMHYARQGIITPEMEFVAIRDRNRTRLNYSH